VEALGRPRLQASWQISPSAAPAPPAAGAQCSRYHRANRIPRTRRPAHGRICATPSRAPGALVRSPDADHGHDDGQAGQEVCCQDSPVHRWASARPQPSFYNGTAQTSGTAPGSVDSLASVTGGSAPTALVHLHRGRRPSSPAPTVRRCPIPRDHTSGPCRSSAAPPAHDRTRPYRHASRRSSSSSTRLPGPCGSWPNSPTAHSAPCATS
jgi:hypothetical protein